MTFTIPTQWFNFALGVICGWASLLALLLALVAWGKRRSGRDG